jgi:hypothetical protein
VSKKIVILRYVYLTLMIVGAAFRIFRLEFINGKLEIAVCMIYYMIAIGSAISFYTNEIKKWDMISFIFYPFLMVLSPIPYETAILFLGIIAIGKNYSHKLKKIILPLWDVSIFLGVIFIVLSAALGSFGRNTIITSNYSSDRQHRVDAIDSDQGALGGDTFIRLYSIHFNIVQRYKRNIYHGTWGEKPKIEWIDNQNININGNIINIKNSLMYENEK